MGEVEVSAASEMNTIKKTEAIITYLELISKQKTAITTLIINKN